MPPGKKRSYKEITFQQLRSFSETARLKSLKAAATALGLAHPTVWEQVHALQRHLGTALIETHGRGCRLTDDGIALVRMIGPLVSDLDSIKRRFLESRQLSSPRLVVAASPRTLVEDLPEVLPIFSRVHPNVQISLKELDAYEVTAAVEAKEIDLGITVDRRAEPHSPWLVFEPCYSLDLILLTPRDHPLARLKRITPTHLKDFPLVTGAGMIPDPAIESALDKLRVFEAQPRVVEARTNGVIRRYVKLGYGIGLVSGRMGLAENRGLHERSLSGHFGRFQVNLVWRKGNQSEATQAFAGILRKQFK